LETLIDIFNWIKVALGLGFVIFLHELGHFLLAKWNGVKVERFSIGFGPALVSFRRGVGFRVGVSRPPGPNDPPSYGETLYILAPIPLGGYVLMLGESPEEHEGEPRPTDPRALNNKSVWARMQIITAGVIMNVILGIVFFAYGFTQGVEEVPARVGGVLPGSPAYKAGLRPGDEIVAIDGERNVGFKQLLSRVTLSGNGQRVRFTVRRAGSDAEQVLEMEPRRDDNANMPTVGLYAASSLELRAKVPFRAMPGQEVPPPGPLGGFEADDRVVGVGPEGGPIEPVADHAEFVLKSEPLRARPMVVEVERLVPREETPKRVKVTVPVHKFVDFGLVATPGPIVAIRPDSPARKAGLKAGDRIVAVHGKKDFDPMRLPDDARAAVGPMTLTVERAAEGQASPSTVEVAVVPDASPAWAEMVDPIGRFVQLDVPGLGLVIAVEPRVRSVREDSPAALAGIKPDDTIRSMTVLPVKVDKATPRPVTLQFDGKTTSWPMAFAWLQEAGLSSVEVTLNRADKPIKLMPEVVPDRFHPLRGLIFQPLTRKMPPVGLAESLRRGVDEAVDNVTSIVLIFRGLGTGRVGADAMGGVIPIAQIAYATASSGLAPFIHFLGFLSINLAVLNFLPIPPLDGGQFCFLAAEGIRGKPLPNKVLNIGQLAGIAFVLTLILGINGKDIFRLIQSYL